MMTYNAKIKLCYINDTETSSNKYFPEIVDKQTITIEAPAQDLNAHQYFELFKSFLRAVGFEEYSIMDAACRVAFNDCNDEDKMKRIMEEYDLQDKQIYSDKDYEDLKEEVTYLKAKLSRFLSPDNPQYTDEEMNAMDASIVTKKKLQTAYQVCNDCGTKYGTYSVGCSSKWMGKCDVCGCEKAVTEARDYSYLNKGIKELSEKNET